MKLIEADADSEKKSYDDSSTSLGCQCDVTKGSCDVYCCCDTNDCDA